MPKAPIKHTTWLTNAFERRPKSSQSLGANWELVGQQTHQALRHSKAPSLDANWLLVDSNKPLHIHLKTKTSVHQYFFFYPSLCFTSNKLQHNQLHSRATHQQTGWKTSGHQVNNCDDTQSWRYTKHICVDIRHAMKSSQCCTIFDKSRNSAENCAVDTFLAFCLLQMSNQAVHRHLDSTKGV